MLIYFGTLGYDIIPTRNLTLHYLSPLANADFVEPVDAGNRSSCRSTYRLTQKGREFVKWH